MLEIILLKRFRAAPYSADDIQLVYSLIPKTSDIFFASLFDTLAPHMKAATVFSVTPHSLPMSLLVRRWICLTFATSPLKISYNLSPPNHLIQVI
jgi:hypothetical protein